MALKHIETSFDPLNLVFKSKTIAAFFGWLLLTILSIVALIGAIAFLVFKYERMETIAIVELKPTSGPFPAVTLCNMNPYKSSAVASSMPDLQYLIDAHEKAMTDRRPVASAERSTASPDSTDTNDTTQPFDREEAISTKMETGSRKKRQGGNACAPNVCDETGLQRFHMPNSTFEFTYFPNMRTTWKCAFNCCQTKKGRKMARIQGDEAYKFLNASGFLRTKIWTPIYFESWSTYSYWRSDPTRNSDEFNTFDQLCSIPATCRLAVEVEIDFKVPASLTMGLVEGNITITQQLVTTTAAVICQEAPATTVPISISKQIGSTVSLASSKLDTKPSSTMAPTIHVNATTPFDSNVNDNSTINTNNTTADPCSCNFDGARRAHNASVSPNIFVLYPQTKTSWSCAFECCQRKRGLRIARVQGNKAYQFLNASGFLREKIWIPVYCSDRCYWRSSPSRNLDRLGGWAIDICAPPLCQIIVNLDKKATSSELSASSDEKTIFITAESISSSAAVLCQEESLNMTSSTNSQTRHEDPTTGLEESLPNTTSTSSTMVVSGSNDGTTVSVDPCQCNFDDSRTTSIPSNSSSSVVVVLFPKMNTTWPCAFECCQRKPRLNMARIEGVKEFGFLKSNGFLEQEIWLPISCPADHSSGSHVFCYWRSNSTGKLEGVFELEQICTSSSCRGGNTISSMTSVNEIVLAASLQGETIEITMEVKATAMAAVLCQEESSNNTSTTAITPSTGMLAEEETVSSASITNMGVVEPVFPPSDLETSPTESSTTMRPSPIVQVAQPTFKETVDKILNDPEIISDPQAVTSTTQDLVPYVVASESPSNLEKLGYTSSEIIFRCTYNGRQCSHENFTLLTDPTYGNCYTFNTDGRNPVSNRPGQGGGLTVAYRVDQSDYLSFVPTYGLKVVLHAQGDPAFPDSSGLSASSGRCTSIMLKQVRIKQMMNGNKACISDKRETPFYYYNETNYATEACIKSCQQASIISACFCGDPRLPLPPGATYAYCNVTARACVNAWHKDNGDKKCDCPQACENEIYESTSTAGLLVGSMSEKNLALIEIYFGSLTTVKYVEQMKYQLFDLLWDISSAIGLFSGMSVLSVFELIQICKGGPTNTEDDAEDEE